MKMAYMKFEYKKMAYLMLIISMRPRMCGYITSVLPLPVEKDPKCIDRNQKKMQ